MKKQVKKYVRSASTGRKIPYNLVSSFVILRDYFDLDDAYINEEHKDLVDIADGLYNVDYETMLSKMKPKYRALYDTYGADYFNKVIVDIEALDSQINDSNVNDLVAEVNDLLATYGDDVEASTRTRSRRPVRASRRITASAEGKQLKLKVLNALETAEYTFKKLSDELKRMDESTFGEIDSDVREDLQDKCDELDRIQEYMEYLYEEYFEFGKI